MPVAAPSRRTVRSYVWRNSRFSSSSDVDRAVGVEERAVDAAVLDGAALVDVLERPAVGDVGLGVTVVVDVDVVGRLRVPRVEVRPAGRLLEGPPVGDHGDGVGVVRADERVGVGVVDRGVALDVRGLAVARRRAGAGRQQRGAADGRGSGERGRTARASPTGRDVPWDSFEGQARDGSSPGSTQRAGGNLPHRGGASARSRPASFGHGSATDGSRSRHPSGAAADERP